MIVFGEIAITNLRIAIGLAAKYQPDNSDKVFLANFLICFLKVGCLFHPVLRMAK